MVVAIGADHGGYEYKEYIKSYFKDIEFIDVGAKRCDPEDDYTVFSFKVAEQVQNCKADKGIMICRTGVGAVIAMNKVKGIRAGVLETTKGVVLARKKNNINCLSFGADNIDKTLAVKIVELFLSTEFEGGRHQRCIDQITQYEGKRNGK